MKTNKKIIAIIGAAIFVLIGVAATTPPEEGFKNLKTLPKKITPQQLDKVMDEFKAALGVKCNFCHVHAKDDPKKWDYASDEKPEKSVARKMITMTNRINKKFFHGKSKVGEENAVLEIRCVTCHNGKAHPEMKEEEEEKSKQ
jgi:cytochrome c556